MLSRIKKVYKEWRSEEYGLEDEGPGFHRYCLELHKEFCAGYDKYHDEFMTEEEYREKCPAIPLTWMEELSVWGYATRYYVRKYVGKYLPDPIMFAFDMGQQRIGWLRWKLAERKCEAKGHDYMDESWCNGDTGGDGGTCKRCGHSWSHTYY